MIVRLRGYHTSAASTVTGGGLGFRALDPATGAIIWSAAGSPSTALTAANGVLYHGTSSGTLVAHDAATGTVL